ncbi:hypothetical protein U0038_18960 [Sphingobacterium spiritivorum]|uniref:Uncharacterized protein n=1 Tax=Sphingobacterium spiritivorum ATCC 33861 TaxID=525373 RepID=D7VJC1_SPHSI|nr:hypothetical protein [Sphingobacterium spiritivorum]EFK58974.1 hypothetical protein HMPREF0766_11090 [Sphingobacterium spiritivorum ATCC 33861]QQT36835.1 hypothetical protein I6J01_05250 [Sphingobacterium spiritivorum]WQD33592.1 hypothetical protein U0038_18960 [Sphingobacterium spiritivorum]SUJ25289.1 Uncharacterised protein [Sphingobacterium spiritivorum]
MFNLNTIKIKKLILIGCLLIAISSCQKETIVNSEVKKKESDEISKEIEDLKLFLGERLSIPVSKFKFNESDSTLYVENTAIKEKISVLRRFNNVINKPTN